MPFPLVGALAAGGITYGLSKLCGGGDKEEPKLPPPPDYYEDPNFTDMQSYLSTYGKNILEGNPNAYYGEMGAYGSPEFEKVLGLSTRDIQQSAAEAAAKAGRGRGGFLPSVIAQTVADNSSKLRYADYLKAMQGRQFLMGEGRGITEGVRGAGFQNQGLRNKFNLESYDFTRNNALFDINRADQAAGQEGEFMSNLFGIGTNALIGGVTGGIPGAFMGAAKGLMGSDILDQIFKSGGGNKTDTLSSGTPGVSSLGKIKSDSDIDEFLKSYSSRFQN